MMNFQNFSEFADAVGVSAQVFTDIKKGKHGISKRLAERIAALDGRLSAAWILTGEGGATVIGDGNTTVGSNSSVTTDSAIVKALDALGKSQEQIDRLLSIVERLT